MSKTKHLTFFRELKLGVAQQLELGKQPVAELACELSIPRNQLYKWREQLQTKGEITTFPGKDRHCGADVKQAALKRENRETGGAPVSR